MMEAIAIAVAFVVLGVAAFVASVRLGILVGRRLDRALEARVASVAAEEPATADSTNQFASGRRGREENRGE